MVVQEREVSRSSLIDFSTGWSLIFVSLRTVRSYIWMVNSSSQLKCHWNEIFSWLLRVSHLVSTQLCVPSLCLEVRRVGTIPAIRDSCLLRWGHQHTRRCIHLCKARWARLKLAEDIINKLHYFSSLRSHGPQHGLTFIWQSPYVMHVGVFLVKPIQYHTLWPRTCCMCVRVCARTWMPAPSMVKTALFIGALGKDEMLIRRSFSTAQTQWMITCQVIGNSVHYFPPRSNVGKEAAFPSFFPYRCDQYYIKHFGFTNLILQMYIKYISQIDVIRESLLFWRWRTKFFV